MPARVVPAAARPLPGPGFQRRFRAPVCSWNDREGTRRFFRARPDAFAELRAFVEDLWDARLADIKTIAEGEP